MVKKIPGSLDYRINLKEQFFDSFGDVVNFDKSYDNTVSIKLFNELKNVTKKWLSLLAWYETGYIHNLNEHLDKIKFCVGENKILSIRCGYLMTFSEPIYFKEGFRVIPCFPRYAINIHSDVIDTFTNEIITNKERQFEYEVIYIYNPDKNGFRYTRVHRLLALAWLPNNDFINRPIVNHIDGIRFNNKLENLEWCSFSENVTHALNTELTKTTLKMKTRDVVTGDVVIYQSVSEMSHKLGMSVVSASNYLNKLPGYLFKRRYEIKLFDDSSPWYFENNEFDHNDHSKSIYTITTLNKKTGEIQKISNVRTFYKRFKLWTKSGRLEDGIALFKERYKDFDVSYKRNAVSGPYRVFNLETKQTVIFDSILEASGYINISRTEMQYDLSRNLKFIYLKKWLVVTGINKLFLEEYKEKPKPFHKIAILNTKDNSEIVARSINHAASISGINDKTIACNLNTGKITKGLSFRALE